MADATTSSEGERDELFDRDGFAVVLVGYSRRQVDEFVSTARARAALQQEQLDKVMTAYEHTRRALAEARFQLSQAIEQLETKPHEEISARMGEILRLAQEEADQARAAGRDEREQLLRDGEDRASVTMEDARNQAAQLLDQAKRQSDQYIAEVQRRADDLLSAAERRASAIDEVQDKRLAGLGVVHVEVLNRMEQIRDVLSHVLATEDASGPVGAMVELTAHAAEMIALAGQPARPPMVAPEESGSSGTSPVPAAASVTTAPPLTGPGTGEQPRYGGSVGTSDSGAFSVPGVTPDQDGTSVYATPSGGTPSYPTSTGEALSYSTPSGGTPSYPTSTGGIPAHSTGEVPSYPSSGSIDLPPYDEAFGALHREVLGHAATAGDIADGVEATGSVFGDRNMGTSFPRESSAVSEAAATSAAEDESGIRRPGLLETGVLGIPTIGERFFAGLEVESSEGPVEEETPRPATATVEVTSVEDVTVNLDAPSRIEAKRTRAETFTSWPPPEVSESR